MRPGDAVMELTRHGFRFRLDGEAVKVKFEGKQKPALELVSPLIDLVRQRKDEVRYFLQCYCPRCGGVVFCPDLDGKDRCLICDWEELARMYPGLTETKH
jgi:hypothetical protein